MSACTACGGAIGANDYCDSCGMLAVAPPPPPRPQLTPLPPTPQHSAETSWRNHVSGPQGSGRQGSGRRSSSVGGGSRAPRLGPSAEPAPQARLIANPSLPKPKRQCRNPRCGQLVGQDVGRHDEPAVVYCRECGWGFALRPPLQPDPKTDAMVVVGNRYEVLGAIGRGGLGWIYLARDLRLERRHVVLKGLHDPEDQLKHDLLLAELKALAGADHPDIVSVHDLVQHTIGLPRPGGVIVVDYIVMEYVPGESLQQLRTQRGANLTVGEAAAFVLPVLGALGHLHARGLVHNDVKPDNIMVTDTDRAKLVDLGAVSLADSDPTYGTRGYRDPGGHPPTAQTDIYSAGRTLAALTMEIPDFMDENPLPGPGTVRLLAENESFHLLLQRATDPDPARRFATTDEFAVQLSAVAREAEAQDHGERPGLSEVFSPELRVVGADEFPRVPAGRAQWAMSLPDTLVDLRDPHAAQVTAVKSGGPREVLATAARLNKTAEIRLLAARAEVELLAAVVEETPLDERNAPVDVYPEPWARGCAALARADTDVAAAEFREAYAEFSTDATAAAALAVCATYRDLTATLRTLESAEPDDVRPAWLRGIAALVVGAVDTADDAFATVRRAVPGEAAPKLARAVCAELRGDPAAAAALYRTVWRTDHSYVSAAFGLARASIALDDHGGAIAVLGSVPGRSRYSDAAALGALAAADPIATTDAELARDFFARAARLDEEHPERLDVDDLTRDRAVVAALRTAEKWLANEQPWPAGTSDEHPESLLEVQIDRPDLRIGVERAFRRMAAHARAKADRIACVDQANRERSWSIW